MKQLTIIILAIALAACGAIGPKPLFSTGQASIEGVSDRQLAETAAQLAYWQGSLYYTSEQEQERLFIKQELKKRNPDWDWRNIDLNRISVGMSESEALLSWGLPTDINRASYGEQWIYRPRTSYSAQYLYFDDGILTAFNES